MHSAITYPAVPLSYRNEWRNNVMGVALAHMALHRYSRNGTGLFQIPSIAETSQFVSLPRLNNSSIAGPTGVRSGNDKVSDAGVVEAADKAGWYLDGVMTAAQTKENDTQQKFCELQTECWVGHTEVFAISVDMA